MITEDPEETEETKFKYTGGNFWDHGIHPILGYRYSNQVLGIKFAVSAIERCIIDNNGFKSHTNKS